jgi:hypothetical protein
MSSLICTVPSDVDVPPQFIVDLNQPPSLRWQHILRLYIGQFRQVEEKIESMINQLIGPWVGPMLETSLSTIMAGVTRLGLVHYGDELKGFSQETGIPLGRLVLMQFVYECFACCTSIVCKNETTNTPVHIRTMDWELDFLKPLTIGTSVESRTSSSRRATTGVDA